MAKGRLEKEIKQSHRRIAKENKKAMEKELKLATTYGKSHKKKKSRKRPR